MPYHSMARLGHRRSMEGSTTWAHRDSMVTWWARPDSLETTANPFSRFETLADSRKFGTFFDAVFTCLHQIGSLTRPLRLCLGSLKILSSTLPGFGTGGI